MIKYSKDTQNRFENYIGIMSCSNPEDKDTLAIV